MAQEEPTKVSMKLESAESHAKERRRQRALGDTFLSLQRIW